MTISEQAIEIMGLELIEYGLHAGSYTTWENVIVAHPPSVDLMLRWLHQKSPVWWGYGGGPDHGYYVATVDPLHNIVEGEPTLKQALAQAIAHFDRYYEWKP